MNIYSSSFMGHNWKDKKLLLPWLHEIKEDKHNAIDLDFNLFPTLPDLKKSPNIFLEQHFPIASGYISQPPRSEENVIVSSHHSYALVK